MTTIGGLKSVLRGLGPYLLVELLLPGGTLLALLLYLSQHGRFALRRLAPREEPHHFGYNRGGAVVEFRIRQVRNEVQHRDKAETGDEALARAA